MSNRRAKPVRTARAAVESFIERLPAAVEPAHSPIRPLPNHEQQSHGKDHAKQSHAKHYIQRIHRILLFCPQRLLMHD